ncbi:MAG: S-layer y domain protein [Firmicutes bacterium]|nr:S-layer y domain protein [Bacillota bacterium]
MKKSIVVVLMLVLVFSFANAALAANPFVDVPKGHWAYDAVKKLAQDGIITGESTNRLNGPKPITRYEMAKAVAKALGKSDKASAEDKALIKRLSAEFSGELVDLNVRVKDLENKVDRFNIGSAVVIKYDDRTWLANAPASKGDERFGDTIPGFMLNTFATYKINDVWSVNMMGQLTRDMRQTTSLVYSNRDQTKNIYAKGRIGAIDVKVGRFDYNDATYATVFGDQISGIQVTFGAPAAQSGPPGGPTPAKVSSDKTSGQLAGADIDADFRLVGAFFDGWPALGAVG